MAFDPNSQPSPKQPEWASYIEDRRPKFKMHANRGQALQAAAYYPRSTQIFRWDSDEGKWIEVWNGVVRDQSYMGRRGGDTCERCGKSTMRKHPFRHSLSNGGYEEGVHVYNDGSYGWLATPTNKNKLVEPFQRAFLCRSCKR